MTEIFDWYAGNLIVGKESVKYMWQSCGGHILKTWHYKHYINGLGGWKDKNLSVVLLSC